MSKTNPGVEPVRLAVAIVLGWLKISSTWMSLTLLQLQQVVGCSFLLLVCPYQPPPETVSQTFLQQSNSTLGRPGLQHLPVRIVPARIRPSCHHTTGSHRHSLVRCMAKKSSDSLNFFEPMCSSLSSDRARKTLEAVVMLMTIRRA